MWKIKSITEHKKYFWTISWLKLNHLCKFQNLYHWEFWSDNLGILKCLFFNFRNLDYVCKESGNCIVDVTRRNQCQSCRFKKCLQVNMKKEGKSWNRFIPGLMCYCCNVFDAMLLIVKKFWLNIFSGKMEIEIIMIVMKKRYKSASEVCQQL